MDNGSRTRCLTHPGSAGACRKLPRRVLTSLRADSLGKCAGLSVCRPCLEFPCAILPWLRTRWIKSNFTVKLRRRRGDSQGPNRRVSPGHGPEVGGVAILRVVAPGPERSIPDPEE